MARVVIVAPDLSSEPGGDSVLRGLPGLRQVAERGQVVRVSPIRRIPAPEALALGMRPPEGQMAAGPLLVAALGAEPPSRSIHFHLSLTSVVDGVIVEGAPPLSEEEARLLSAQISRLSTKTLTVLPGFGFDHGLVWEEWDDLGTTALADAYGKPYRTVLPEGDGEAKLRRLIDDSVDLLTGLEFNQRRVSDGVLPLNLLWPWGHGARQPVPHLPLRYGEPGHVETSSLRMMGLARMVGYKASSHPRGVGAQIIWWEEPARLRHVGDLEKLDWEVRKWDRERIQTLLDGSLENPLSLLIASPRAEDVGLALIFDSQSNASSSLPFDERALEDGGVPTLDLAELVARTLTPRETG